MPWWHLLMWIVVGVLAFDCLLIGMLCASNRPRRRCPTIVPPDAKSALAPKLWTIDRDGR